MNFDILKDFFKAFIPSNFNYEYDRVYALKAERHAMNPLSSEEVDSVIYHLYKDNVPANLKILDVGCNTGIPLMRFLNSTHNSLGFGIDINKYAIEQSNFSNDNLFLSVYDGEVIPFDDSYFDHVMLHHVIGHVKSPDQMIREINRVLKPGGSLSIITPNLWYKLFILPKNFVSNFHPDTSILRYFTKNRLKLLLEINGFSTNYFYYYGEKALFSFEFTKLRICSISFKKPV